MLPAPRAPRSIFLHRMAKSSHVSSSNHCKKKKILDIEQKIGWGEGKGPGFTKIEGKHGEGKQQDSADQMLVEIITPHISQMFSEINFSELFTCSRENW